MPELGNDGSFIHLTETEVERLAPSPGELADALAEAFRLRHTGAISMPPKMDLTCPDSDAFFHAMPASVAGIGAGLKWVGGSPTNAARSEPHVHALMLLSDGLSGRSTALIEAGFLTGIRTAAVSLLAARHLARADASTLALIGCGAQARAHLEAFRSTFPLEKVLIHGRRRESMEAFAGFVEAAGLTPRIAGPDDALAEADIVTSTVPAQEGLAPFLDAGLLRPGAMVSMVDLGRSWVPKRLGAFDRIYTDDLEQSRALSGRNPTFAAARFAGDLAALAAGAVAGRRSEAERLAFLFPGPAFADVVTADLLVRRARRERSA